MDKGPFRSSLSHHSDQCATCTEERLQWMGDLAADRPAWWRWAYLGLWQMISPTLARWHWAYLGSAMLKPAKSLIVPSYLHQACWGRGVVEGSAYIPWRSWGGPSTHPPRRTGSRDTAGSGSCWAWRLRRPNRHIFNISSRLLNVHRTVRDRGAQDGHLDFHTTPTFQKQLYLYAFRLDAKTALAFQKQLSPALYNRQKQFICHPNITWR